MIYPTLLIYPPTPSFATFTYTQVFPKLLLKLSPQLLYFLPPSSLQSNYLYNPPPLSLHSLFIFPPSLRTAKSLSPLLAFSPLSHTDLVLRFLSLGGVVVVGGFTVGAVVFTVVVGRPGVCHYQQLLDVALEGEERRSSMSTDFKAGGCISSPNCKFPCQSLSLKFPKHERRESAVWFTAL